MTYHILSRRGFTLVELIAVIAIIGVLATATMLSLNVTKLRADSRNLQRQNDVAVIMNSVYQYAVDNNNQLPAAITTNATAVCRTGAANCSGLIDLSVLTANQKYLVALPVDPNAATVSSTGYTIMKNANNRITVAAPSAEQGATVSLTR